MPAFRCQVHYRRNINEKWSNVWHIFATGVGDAAAAAGTIMVPHLLDLLDAACTLDNILVTDPITAAYNIVPVNTAGNGTSGGSLLPLFNSVKVEWPTAAGGRPDYKFLKGYLTEALHDAGNLGSGIAATVAAELTALQADMVANSTPLCSNSGDAWGTAAVQNEVQMRQMHRRRKRLVAP